MLSGSRLLLCVVAALISLTGSCTKGPTTADTRQRARESADDDRPIVDRDDDGEADDADADLDGDGIANAADSDIDGDRLANEIDDDIDGDGVGNRDDETPLGFSPPGATGPWVDTDGDGQPNLFDTDDNNDGLPDGVDGDGSCDGGVTVVSDENADCDGYCIEVEAGLSPCNDGAVPGSGLPDSDGDDVPDVIDDDDDGDGLPDDDDDNPRGNDPCVGIEGPVPESCFEEPGEGEGEGEGEPDPVCSTQTFDPVDPIPPRILLVVDRSGSMGETANGFNGSKWAAAREALIGPPSGANTGVIGQLATSVEFGLFMYPSGPTFEEQCLAGSSQDGVALGNFVDIRNAMNGTVPGGGTPTAPALFNARAELSSLPADGGQRAVILVTDGGPNCNESLDGSTCRCVVGPVACTFDDDCSFQGLGGCGGDGLCELTPCEAFPGNCIDDANTIAAANQLNQAGFPVFVLGIDGALAFSDVLTGIAQAGGTGAFFGIGSTQALASTIEDIATRVGSCRFEVRGAPRREQVDVEVDGAVIPLDTSRQNGWDLVGVSTIELFGTACDAAQGATQNVSVEICR